MITKLPAYRNRGGEFPAWCDCFMGRCFYSDVAPALRTRSVNDNNDFIVEKVLIPQATKEGFIECEVRHIEPKAVSYTRGADGKTENKHLNDIVNTIHQSTGHGGNTDCLIAEPQILRKFRTEEQKERRRRLKDKGIKFSEANKAPAKDGCRNTLTSVQKDNLLCEPTYRIRKLTPRECFRLMGVDDPSIDKLLGASISNSQLYKCAGNSIVVDVLYHIFRKIYVEPNPDNGVQTLF